MESSSVNSQLSELFNSTRGRRRLAVIAMIAVLAIVIWFNVPRAIETCELIEGCRLRKNDLQRIQLALSQAGLNEFDIVEGNVHVPKSQRDVYLRAVSDGNALPQDLAPRQEDSTSFNPLLSRTQQEQMQQAKKEKQVTDMVMRLPFVEQAWFEMDRTKSRSSFQKDEQAAVILIQPTDEMPLDYPQVETIRDLIKGAIAGIDPESIVVTDLSTGVAIKNSNNPVPNATGQRVSPIHSVSTEINMRARYERQILQALEDFDGIEVTVSIEIVELEESNDLQANRPTRKPNVIQIGTNGQATVDEPKGVTETSRKKTVERISALIQVPEALLVEHLPAEIRESESRRQGYSYRAKLSEIKSEIIGRVRPILPNPVRDEGEPLIEVQITQQKDNDQVASTLPQPWYEQIMERVGGPIGAGSILVAGMLILLYVFSGSRKSIPEQAAPVATAESGNADEEAPAGNEQSIKEEISKLIHEDPEAAAKVIKRWIRNAA